MNRDNKALCDMRAAVEESERRATAVSDAVTRVVTTRRLRAVSSKPAIGKPYGCEGT